MEHLQAVFALCLKILDSKGHDYSGEEDALSNFHDFGFEGMICRLGDKYHRVKNFCRTGVLKVADEKIDDTLLDLINYAALALIYRWSHKEK